MPRVGNTGNDARLGLALKEEEVKEPPVYQPSQANGLLPVEVWGTPHGGWHMSVELLLLHSARLLAAKCHDGRPTGRGDIRGWRPLNEENLGKDILIGWV